MHSFGFKVVPSDDGAPGVPVAVAGQTMVDIQRLLTDIGSMSVRLELRIQNRVPDALSRKFDLSIGGVSDDGIGSDPAEGDEALMESALDMLGRTLDFLGKGVVGTWMTDNYPEPVGRARIARDIIDLHDHLCGMTLIYGTPEDQREFRRIDREKLLAYAEEDVSSVPAAFIGVISRDPVRKNRWLISNSASPVDISFDSNIAQSDIPSFASAGPVIVTGMVMRDADGDVTGLRSVNGRYTFPEVKFHRIVTPERDIVLLNPTVAHPSYDAAKGLWHLSCDELGIDVSKPTWDECVSSYHEYFAFLWEEYCESDGELEGEELDIRNLLRSMASMV